MDAVGDKLLQFGIGGIMAAAVIIHGWFMATKIIPQLLAQRDNDLAWCRNQIDQKRIQFLQEIQSQRKDLLEGLSSIQAGNQQALTEVMAHCDREVAHLALQLSRDHDRLGHTIGQLTSAVNELKGDKGNRHV